MWCWVLPEMTTNAQGQYLAIIWDRLAEISSQWSIAVKKKIQSLQLEKEYGTTQKTALWHCVITFYPHNFNSVWVKKK